MKRIRVCPSGAKVGRRVGIQLQSRQGPCTPETESERKGAVPVADPSSSIAEHSQEASSGDSARCKHFWRDAAACRTRGGLASTSTSTQHQAAREEFIDQIKL